MKKRFTEEQIIGVLKEAHVGAKVAEFGRKYDISDATYYNWKAKFGGMTVRRPAVEGAGSRECEAKTVVG
jgi:putative transposase